jgi:tetratricopeptide (TPR) repeat protein
MNNQVRSRPAAALLTLLLLVGASDAMAQVGRYDPVERDAHKHKTEEADTTAKYPGAKRESPELQATKKGGKELNEIVDLYKAKDYAQVMQRADALAASSGNAYERSFAFQIAGTAAADAGDDAKAASYFKQAVDGNGLNNDDHYQVMFNLAVEQYKTGQYKDALATLDRFDSETGSDPSVNASLRGEIMAKLGRPEDSAAMFADQFHKDPTNKTALMNAVAMYQQANQFEKANALLIEAKGKGLLNDAAGYHALYVGYINAGKLTEAVATIDEGLAKGLLHPNDELANAYAVIAQTAYADGDTKTAIDMYGRAAKASSNGESSLNLARVLMNEGRTTEAKQAAQQALDKGVKNEADARKILGKSGK